MSADRPINVLLVEDDADDAHLVRSLLDGSARTRFQVSCRSSLAEALAELGVVTPDVVLLDLSLPDSQGFEGLNLISHGHRRVPVVVLTGLAEAEAGIEALGLGAEDYLLKTGLDTEVLVRTLRYARERRALQVQLEELREQERRDREQAAYERLLAPPRATVTAGFYGATELSESAPHLHGELVQRYGQLLESHFAEAPRPGEPSLSRALDVMSESMGLMYAGPRDVIRVHQEALRRYTSTATESMARAMTNEGRLMLVELMGYLMAWYRRQATGLPINAAAPGRPRDAQAGKDA